MLRWMYGVTRMDKKRNEYIRIHRNFESSASDGKVEEQNKLAWYGNGTRKEKDHVTRRVINMNVEGYMGRGSHKKRWTVCVKDNMSQTSVNSEMTADRGECTPTWISSREYCRRLLSNFFVLAFSLFLLQIDPL